MPVKISTVTNPATGEVTRNDLVNMESDFDINVELRRINAGNPIIKKIAWYVTREEVEELFKKMTVGDLLPDLLEINFAVHLSGVVDVCGSPLGGNITVVLETKDKYKNPIPAEQEYVLIPGYGTNTNKAIVINNLHGYSCCPSSKPPTNP